MSLEQQNWPFRIRVALLTFTVALMVVLVVGLPLSNAARDYFKSQQKSLHYTLTQQASTQAADAIFTNDLVSLNVMLTALVSNPGVAYAAVYDIQNHIIAEKGVAQSHLEDSTPVRLLYQDQMIGSFNLILDPENLQQPLQHIYSLWFALSLITLLIATWLGWWIGDRHGTKLDKLRAVINDADEDATDLNERFDGELSQLAETIMSNGRSLYAKKQMQVAIEKFAGIPNVSSKAKLENETYAEVAVLFIDIANVQQAQHAFGPHELAQMLNKYHGFIQQAARLYNGQVTQYVGQGMMVVFGLPQPDEKDAFHGVCSAMLLLGILESFNENRKKDDLPMLSLKMGIHGGTVLAGQLSIEGSDTHQHHIMGPPAHLAARLADLAQPNAVLVSEQLLKEREMPLPLEATDAAEIKAEQPGAVIQAYQIKSLASNYQALIERQVQHICSQATRVD